MRGTCLALAAVGFGVVLPGCGDKPEPAKVPVKGKVVTLAGGPVAWVEVTFSSEGKDQARYTGTAGKDGTFALSCPKGSYRVTLVKLPPQAGAPEDGPGVNLAPGQTFALPEEYRDPRRTPLQVQVPEKGIEEVRLIVDLSPTRPLWNP